MSPKIIKLIPYFFGYFYISQVFTSDELMFFAEANIAHFGPMFHMPPLLLTLFLSSFFILSSSILLAHLTRRGVWSRSAAVIRSGWLLFEMTFLFGSFPALFVSSTNWKIVVQDRSWYEVKITIIYRMKDSSKKVI